MLTRVIDVAVLLASCVWAEIKAKASAYSFTCFVGSVALFVHASMVGSFSGTVLFWVVIGFVTGVLFAYLARVGHTESRRMR